MSPLAVHLPNLLTLSRLFLIPLFVFFLVAPTSRDLTIASGLFFLAASTDWLDGFLARRWKVVSDLGKLLDPLADKILVMAALVMMVGVRIEPSGHSMVPAWLVVLIIAREIWVTGVRAVAAREGVVLAASSGGKLKSFFQMLAVILLLLHSRQFPGLSVLLDEGLSCHYVGMNLLLLSTGISLYSAFEYTYEVLILMKSSRQD